jgi:hypothetical protein
LLAVAAVVNLSFLGRGPVRDDTDIGQVWMIGKSWFTEGARPEWSALFRRTSREDVIVAFAPCAP